MAIREPWKSDAIQFPRLLSEIYSTIDLQPDHVKAVMDSMDITERRFISLFNRAGKVFERNKKFICPVGSAEPDGSALLKAIGQQIDELEFLVEIARKASFADSDLTTMETQAERLGTIHSDMREIYEGGEEGDD